jgi:hypothetical protein
MGPITSDKGWAGGPVHSGRPIWDRQFEKSSLQSPGPVNSKKRIPEASSTRGSALNHFDLLLRERASAYRHNGRRSYPSARACCSAERKTRLLAHGMSTLAANERDPNALH